jgi:hypothetical protein
MARMTVKTVFLGIRQLGGRLELRDGIEFLEGRCECIRETPDRPRTEFLVRWFEVQIVNRAGQVFRSLLLPHSLEFLLHRSTLREMQSMSENDFECLVGAHSERGKK